MYAAVGRLRLVTGRLSTVDSVEATRLPVLTGRLEPRFGLRVVVVVVVVVVVETSSSVMLGFCIHLSSISELIQPGNCGLIGGNSDGKL